MDSFYNDALETIRRTRDISLPQFGTATIKAYKDTETTDGVTEIDENIENFLHKELSALDPTVGFSGEETGGARDWERYWLVDPVDGTGLYTRGMPYCTTIVSLIENDRVIFGVIYDFVNDIVYYAVRGQGAFANDEPLKVSSRSMVNDRAYVGYEMREDDPDGREVRAKLLSRCGPIKFPCSGYEYVLIAKGQIEGRVCSHPYGYDYDFAAGCLLVEEAGGRAANIGRTDYRPSIRPHLATNQVLFTELTEGPSALFPVKE